MHILQSPTIATTSNTVPGIDENQLWQRFCCCWTVYFTQEFLLTEFMSLGSQGVIVQNKSRIEISWPRYCVYLYVAEFYMNMRTCKFWIISSETLTFDLEE